LQAEAERHAQGRRHSLTLEAAPAAIAAGLPSAAIAADHRERRRAAKNGALRRSVTNARIAGRHFRALRVKMKNANKEMALITEWPVMRWADNEMGR
jgi:hypothetical protein